MDIDKDVVAALNDRPLGPEHKSLPPTAWGRSVREYLATGPRLADLQTPILTLDRAALDSNLAVMADWAGAAGVRLAPHGKTTMAPQLWAEQLAAGAWGITLATVWQAQLARSYGLNRILLANAALDPVGLRWVAHELATDPNVEFVSWVDGVAGVREMERALTDAPAGVRLRVLVELGGPHGRTGARTRELAREIAEALHASPRLILAGVGGYEGALAHDRTPTGIDAVRTYLHELASLHRELAAAGLYEDRAIVTAGGSAYPDLVVEHLAGLADESGAQGIPATVILRSGAYLVHDDGFYAGISPLTARDAARPLRSAMHGWARTISRPEPELALLDAGKRDLPFDEGLPVPQRLAEPAAGSTQPSATSQASTTVPRSEQGAAPARGLEAVSAPGHLPGAETVPVPGSGSSSATERRSLPESALVSALNDQHTFLRLPGSSLDAVPVGSVVRLGLSHPCTAFDKWRLIPVIDDADAVNPRIVDFVHTFF